MFFAGFLTFAESGARAVVTGDSKGLCFGLIMKTPGAAYGDNYQGIVKGREGVYKVGFLGVFGRVPPCDGRFQAVSGVEPK